MSYLKFTNNKGQVYDSRKPIGEFLDCEFEDKKSSNPEPINERTPIYNDPKGESFWIKDYRLARVLECEVDEIHEKLKSIQRS